LKEEDTIDAARIVGLCTRGVGSRSDDAALPGAHGEMRYRFKSDSASDDPPASSSTPSTDAAMDAVVAVTGEPNEPIASAILNDIVVAPSSSGPRDIVPESSSSSSSR
jgi:hypothetical protein